LPAAWAMERSSLARRMVGFDRCQIGDVAGKRDCGKGRKTMATRPQAIAGTQLPLRRGRVPAFVRSAFGKAVSLRLAAQAACRAAKKPTTR
jgi:hypothetical protein